MTGENVFTKFIRILHDPKGQVTPRQFTFLELNQEPSRSVEWPTLTISPERQ